MDKACVFIHAPWYVFFADIVEGVGGVLLGTLILYATRRFQFGPVTQGLKTVFSLVAYSFILLGVGELLVAARKIHGGPLFILESAFKSAAGAAVFATALVVLKYGHGILDVLGATRHGNGSRVLARDHGDSNSPGNDRDSLPPVEKS